MGEISFIYANDNNSTKIINEETPFIISNKLSSTGIVKHGFSTRLGGVSTGFFSSLNLGFTRGDERDLVIENHIKISKAIGFDYKDIVTSKQTHTTNIKVVTKEDMGKGIIKDVDFSDVDGFITNESGIPLATYYADCVPLFFVDVEEKAIGLSHSGWKGTVNKMGLKTVEAMTREFGTKPENIVAFIGPSICQKCYEISKDVAEEFENVFSESDLNKIMYKKSLEKYQLDLWKANEIIMLEAGVKKENIDITNICTCCNNDLLFSHRASNGKRGNLGAFLILK